MVWVLSFFEPAFFRVGLAVLLLVAMALAVDSLLLLSRREGLRLQRKLAERFSIGDENKVTLVLENRYVFPLRCRVVDELPLQFQARDWERYLSVPGRGTREYTYSLRPTTRGEYWFHDLHAWVPGPLRLVRLQYRMPAEQLVKVYPSFVQMRRYQLLALSNRLQEAGVKRIRRIGHSLEFEQIKEYVRGDDYRTINWKATARKSGLMVNNYTDERSQQIYCLINKGRVMKMPFQGMHLLDHAINAALVLSNVALVRQDKAGLITFEKNLDTFLPADKKPTQMNLLLENLYRQQTQFLEADYEKLFSVIRNRITNRSLLVLFTNFESLQSLQRELPALKRMARYHLLLVVFFENTELQQLLTAPARDLEAIYQKTIAAKFAYEKRQMVKELQAQGILTLLTTPENLTVHTINKYLELKTRGAI